MGHRGPHPPDKAWLLSVWLNLKTPWIHRGFRKDRDLDINLSLSWKPVGSTWDTFLLRGWPTRRERVDLPWGRNGWL